MMWPLPSQPGVGQLDKGNRASDQRARHPARPAPGAESIREGGGTFSLPISEQTLHLRLSDCKFLPYHSAQEGKGNQSEAQLKVEML